MKILAADFETTNKNTSETSTRVWAWGTRELFNPDSFKYGHNIESFFKSILKGESKIVYFHNLKFDGFFILDYLMKNDYKPVKQEKGKKAIAKTFNTLITKEGIFYAIEVIVAVTQKNVRKVVFRDSHKKLPFPIKRIAVAFNLPLLKGDIDHNKVRPPGYIMDQAERDYLFNDVEILALALEIQYNEGMDGMTIGGDSLGTFKELFGKQRFKDTYPILEPNVDAFIRKSYKGGFTYLNPKYKDQVIEGGCTYDVNSLYPATMLKPLPYGDAVYFTGEYKENEWFPLYVQRLKCEFKLKEDHIPTIQLKGNGRFGDTEYITETKNEPETITLTNIDLQLFFDHYDVQVYEYLDGYMFRSSAGVFDEYIEKFMEIKKREKGAKRELAKLLLNNLYGKFGSSTDATGKDVTLSDDGKRIQLVEGEEEEKKPIYIPIATFITSYAREITIRAAQKEYDRFIYCDTDSLHLVGTETPDSIWIDQKELGAWKHEYNFRIGKFIRAKTYYEITEDDEKVVRCAGMPQNVKDTVTFEGFETGEVFEGKLVPKIVEGGVILVEREFTIKV